MLALASPAQPFTGVPELPRRSLFGLLQRRRRLFFATVLGVLALVAGVLLLSPKTYTTRVEFIAGSAAAPGQGSAGQTILPVLNAILGASSAQSADTYAEILRQTPTLERVIRAEHLALTPRQLLSHIKVKPVTNTSILDVSVSWSDPQGSARIANRLADGFLDVRRELIGAQADSAIAYVGGQIPAARARMRASADALAAYQSANGIADADAQTQSALAALSEVERKYAAVEVDRQQAAAQLNVVRGQLAGMPATVSGSHQVAPNPAAAQLKTQLAQLDVQLETALAQYTEEHPTVRSLRTQEAQLRREIASAPATIVAGDTTVANPVRQAIAQSAATLGSQIASDDAQLAALRAQRARAAPAIERLPRRAAELAVLKRQAKQDEDVYNALAQKLGDARIARTTTPGDVSVIARASAADAQASPHRTVDLAIGFVVALLLGLGAVLLAERFDRSVKVEDDVVERLGLPVLASLPRLPADGGPTWLRAAAVDSFLQLVTALRYASSERLVTIAFASPDAQDGKSVVALKTAIALAELTPRVLLVDADLRLPSLHTKLDMRREPGLSDVLVGTASFDEAIRATPHAGLDVVAAGTIVPNAYALLQSQAFARFLEQARTRYETVLLDTPACGSVIDAALVCAQTDGTVYVLASHETGQAQAERGLVRLRAAGVRNVVGAVLNKVTPARSGIGAYGEAFDGRRALPLPPARGQRRGDNA
ncbi:MAG: tyrosine-protein kinase Etk/Wzc [Candidatus Eremiobacteraeota bacterium]|jgi:capsular exopolysaccharide synthesis family protein|nr:tyrosine-protein kinase Etk/Wzc [Candidatus Eremiobacteraeota bacterium]